MIPSSRRRDWTSSNWFLRSATMVGETKEEAGSGVVEEEVAGTTVDAEVEVEGEGDEEEG